MSNNPKILFYVNYAGPPKSADYQHCMIAIAEGLQANNIPYDSNETYYKVGNSYLFQKKDNICHDDYDYIITGFSCGSIGRKLYAGKTSFLPMDVLTKKNRKYKTVMIDWSDGYFTFLRKNAPYYDYCFSCSYGPEHEKLSNVYPLCFSATNRIIDACKVYDNVAFPLRTIDLFQSHRVTNHQIRNYALNHIYSQYESFVTFFNDGFPEVSESDSSYIHWAQSGRRHNPCFYEKISQTKVMDCLGGHVHKNGTIFQIDSFKLWEAFFSGCCVLMVHLDRFRLKFPYQPVNLEHYIGFTLNKEQDLKILDDIVHGRIDTEKIARQGKKWAEENYTPKEVSSYILDVLNKNKTKNVSPTMV